MFNAARGTRASGRWCLGAHLSRTAKREVRNIFYFCVLIPMEVFENQEDYPNYLALKDYSNKLKMPGRNILQILFKEESYCDPGEGDTPYIMTPYGAAVPAVKRG